MSQYFTANDYFVLLPAIILALFGCGILLVDTLASPKDRKYLPIVSLIGLAFTAYELVLQQKFLASSGAMEAFQGSLTVDGFALFFNWIFLIAAAIISIVSYKYLEIEGEHHEELKSLMTHKFQTFQDVSFLAA